MARGIPNNGMDTECVALCDAMNALSGVTTVESCCGHGEWPFAIWFVVDSLDALPRVCYAVAACHSGVAGWGVSVRSDCAMSPVRFKLEGPRGDYKGAAAIAGQMSTP